MKQLILLSTLLFFTNTLAVDHSDLDSSIDKHQELFENIAMQIWDIAEVGYQEHKSSKLLQDTLKDHGFNIQNNVAKETIHLKRLRHA